jgi:Cu(I)/Ag(I) efflux system membrane fusion protein
MNRSLALLLALAATAAASFLVGRSVAPAAPTGGAATPAGPVVSLWTCPMHPDVQLPEAVPCPVCGMELVPFDPSAGPGPGRVALSPEAVALAGVRTATVERDGAARAVRLVGMLERDETSLRTVSANVPGRIERLFVDRVGVEVRAGEHLFEIYSPALYSAQTELVQAVERIAERGGNQGAFFDESLERNLRSARDKLVLYGLDPEQIDAIEQSRDADQRIVYRSPVNGTVVARHVEQGDYVTVGKSIYELAGLEHLWLELEAHEQDLPWLAWGQAVVAEFEALPGELFEGRVSFIDPELDRETRTVSLRVHLPDGERRLKPGMFARATVLAAVGADGRAIRPDFSGLWVSPMHPEVISDAPGACTVCGMDLVPAEELGLAGGSPSQQPLLVPETALLWTGTRSVAWVELPGSAEPTFELREVRIGPRVGDRVVVLAGLEAGERVVAEGAFRVDSAMQIRGGRSMLAQPGDAGPGAGPEGAAFRAGTRGALEAYLELARALAADDFAAAKAGASRLADALPAAMPALLPRRAESDGARIVAALTRGASAAGAADSIEVLRGAFEPLSRAMIELVERFGAPGPMPLRRMHCPMAFDDAGADWLQAEPVLANPYFGASMLRCGEQRRLYTPEPDRPASAGERAGDAPAETEAADPQSATPAGSESASRVPAHAEVWAAYLEAQGRLADDDGLGARLALERLGEAGDQAAAEGAPGREQLRALARAVADLPVGAALESLRAKFEPVSAAVLELLEHNGNLSGRTLVEAWCPMAFDNRGAGWVQGGEPLANPYFGSTMLRCGSLRREFTPDE